MLRFEKLELGGFKSFADKLEVTFDHRVTAVIGPNGCGKSNLFDAIGWVLGSQSPRSLRGDKMEEVIFSGSRGRKPSGLSEVALTLRRLPGQAVVLNGRELEGDTVEICRKLYRSGESHYLINQKRCRLKDIQQVLEELGLGFASYALIPQGRIDSFLTGRPSDRRAVVEEAARILSYKSRRRSAEVKLEMAQQNLLRVNDIIAEVERRLRSLKRQAAKARRYKEVKAEFRRVQRHKLKLESELLGEKLSQCGSQLEELRAGQKTLEDSWSEAQQKHRAASRERDQLEEQLNQLQQKRSELVLEIDRSQSAIRHHQEQIEATSRYIESTCAEQKTIQDALENLASELKAFSGEELQIEEEAARLTQQLERQSALMARHAGEVESAEARIEELTKRQMHLTAQRASLENLCAQLESRLDDSKADQLRLETSLEQSRLQIEEAEAELIRRRGQLEQHRAEAEKLRQALEAAEQRRVECENELRLLQEASKEGHERLIALRERLQSLEEVQLNHSQYSEGVRKFLNHLRGSQSVRARGTLADLLETDSQYENLVEGFLDEELEFVLVESMQEAVQGLSELKNLKSGKCTFLTLTPNGFGQFESAPTGEMGKLIRESGVLGPLRSLLHMEPEIEDAFYRVLPQQAEAVVVSDLGRALDLAHSYPSMTFVTLEGETLSPRGLLAANSQNSKKLGLLSLKRQKKQLESKIAELLQSGEGLKQREDALAQRLQSVLEERDHTQAEIHQMEKSSLTLQHQTQQQEADFERLQAEYRGARRELDQLLHEQQRCRNRLQEAVQQHEQQDEERRQNDVSVQQSRESLRQIRSEWERLQEQSHRLSSSRQVLEERRAALQRTLRRVQDQREDLEKRQEEAEQSVSRSRERVEQRTAELGQLKVRLGEMEQECAQLDAELEQVQQEYRRSREAIPVLEDRLSDLSQQKSELQEKISRLQVERARWETQLQSLDQQCREQLHATLEEAIREVVPEQTLEEISQRYEQLRSRLDSFGPINMTALQEYQESEERYTFLSGQRQDIEASIADTKRAIQDLNRRSLEKFKEAFEAVNRHFQEFFQRLFGGGECGMRLLDEEDLLESGIDIFAQPPGKKLQNVMLLSGGEKALTVLALLMGLFAYRPSKFCVLDEVDAPLDDANVIRYTNLVREMSEKTQLILITHNKRTMQVADSLYGVTMSEPGVSEVVSVQLSQPA